MQHKLKQFLIRHKRTMSNRLPMHYSRLYLFNMFRQYQTTHANDALRASLGLLRWQFTKTFSVESRISYRVGCFLTGRNRGVSKRFSISRVRVKHLISEGKLFGSKKSSW